MSFDFAIPLARDDLLTRSVVDQYVVDEVYPLRILPSKLQEFTNAFRVKGALAVLNHFDSVYSVLKNIHHVDAELKEDSWELVLKVLSSHANVLVEVLEGELDPQLCRLHVNSLKMNCYLLCQFIDVFEGEVTKPTQAISGKGRKKSQKSKAAELGHMEWEMERQRGIRVLLQLLQLAIHRLWDPPVCEEEFVNLVSNCCYKLMENPGVARDKATKDTIFQLLGVMVKRYNHALSCSLKIITLLQHFDHLASPMAQAVELFATQFGVKSVVAEIMREIGRIDPKDLARDTSGTRAYAAFLVELAEKIPHIMLPSISVLLTLLDGESYSMRNSVLGVLGAIVVKLLSKEALDDKLKATREQFLDKLEDHVHDVNAFSRSKTLQIWFNVVSEKALPLARQITLLELVTGRLQDKSSQVRKYAIQLVTALLRSNPFAAKLPLEELQLNYEKEKEKLKEMMEEKVEETPEELARREVNEAWQKLEVPVREAVTKFLTDGETESEADDPDRDAPVSLISDDESLESVKTRITSHLKDEEYISAIRLYQSGKESWPQDPAFIGISSQKQQQQQQQQPKDGEDEGEQEEQGDEGKDVMDQEETEVENEEKKTEEIVAGLKAVFLAESLPAHLIMEVAQGGSGEDVDPHHSHLVNEYTKQQVLVQYLKDSMNFVSLVQRAVPTICQLLGSKNNTDVLEAMDFFVTSFEFGVSNAMQGVRRMLVLVWSKEASVKDALVESYKRLYMKPAGGNARSQALAVVSNLTALSNGATVGDLASLEELVKQFVKTGELNQRVIQVLWERFAMKIPTTTAMESRAALTLLGMAAGAEPDIVKSNVDVLVKEGLGARSEDDFLLAKEVCMALIKMVPTKPKAGQVEEPFRFPQDHEIFQRLVHILVTGVKKNEAGCWIPMAEQATNVIYRLAEHPDVICSQVLKKLANIAISYQQGGDTAVPAQQTVAKDNPAEEGSSSQMSTEPSEEPAAESQPPADPAASSSPPPPSSSSQPCSQAAPTAQCPAAVLTRLLSLAGHVALRQLVHLDVDVFNELKRRYNVQEQKEQDDAAAAASSKRPKTTSQSSVSSSNRKKRKPDKEKEPSPDMSMEEELGMTGATADDAEGEYIRHITEQEIVSGSNLLAVMRPLLVAVCNNQVKYQDPDLRAAASLALAKFMTVSSSFCESHLQLLFTILEKSPHPVIRSNTIIALGDLTFRFPNLIEPWTPNLYARLRDESAQVRKNTLMVLTHLILNDMVKVKGQISEMATCIVDHNTNICNLAKLFFFELSQKGNAIYNIMPDIISRLSDPDIGIQEDYFRTIMKYLFSFIQKDRHCESLVEKLCHRFRATRVERQWRDLAFCLSLLTYSEKSLRKLQENFACFADKLADEDVFQSFTTAINSAKKFAKPETKALVDEMEEKLQECHSKGREDDEAAQNAVVFKTAKAKRKSRSPKTPRVRGRGASRKGVTPRARRLTEDSGEADDSDEDFLPRSPKKAPKNLKGRPKPSFSSEDDESELDLFHVEKGKNKQGLRAENGADEFDLAAEVSDTENCDPNVSVLSPTPVIKKRHKSVNQRAKDSAGVRTSNRNRATLRN